ncbi:serine/threonine-protein kinase [Streptomyces sp. TLI_146]|uniref:serine/threonine-protein kinase n=1 Tax=Streptomyces sp. TLI_146 TaxID=1938858 RepID=UPI000C708DAA|nr:serine/threonine-protein kinase [Streptomyces sp. TLI_146]PKV84177.1 serine/threonine protein kinase [Streptomyces sp. TLI_146]
MSSGENDRLAGRYRLIEQLGRGGMGVVWRAVDEVLGREVAVKELRTYSDMSAPELGDLRLRMQREARAAARVRHPGVVAVHDVTEHEGRPVIVMELVEGPSLDGVLAERGALDAREAAAIGARVLEALAAAHRAGVLHRDVKPGNILLESPQALGSARAGETPIGRVVLTDFGIAAMDDPGDGSATHLTRSGELVGSLDYLAPERAQGQDPGPASDVWALGATLYAAVEGSSPFRRTSTWSTLSAIVAEPLPEPVRAGRLGPVLRELMHKDPARRPDADTAARMLAAVAEGRDPGLPQVPAPRPVAPPREATVRDVLPHRPQGFGPVVTQQPTTTVQPPRGRGRALVAAGVAAVVLAGAGVTYALVGTGDDDGTRQQAVGSASGASPSASGAQDGTGGAWNGGGASAASPGPTGKDGRASASPGASRPAKDGKGGTGGTGSGEKGGTTPGKAPTGGHATATPGGAGGAAGGGTGSTPAPSCQSIGGGKSNCQVWRTAKSYRYDGGEMGVLNAGTNYFYCQVDLGRRETYGKWTNTYWARTDDDSGNTNVYVSVVYLKGGANNAPVPGLPVC